MGETLDRRVQYTEEAKKMSDREIREFTFIELRDLSHHVRVDQNGKIKKMWTAYQWVQNTVKVMVALGTVYGAWALLT